MYVVKASFILKSIYFYVILSINHTIYDSTLEPNFQENEKISPRMFKTNWFD